LSKNYRIARHATMGEKQHKMITLTKN